MKIITHATGSSGNAYTLEEGRRKILIDPGIPYNQLKQKTGYRLSEYDFVLVSHEHKDHCQSVKHLIKIGLPCVMSEGTALDLGLDKSLAERIEHGKLYQSDGWEVIPFDVFHDCAEPLGFLIRSPLGKKIVYATDTGNLPYVFPAVTHWIVECNHSKELIAQNSAMPGNLKHRVSKEHMSLESLKELFSLQNLYSTEQIHLIHLSESNSDEKIFKEEIEKATGKPVFLW